MSRAVLSDIQSSVYQYLNIDGGTFGTYVANARYPSAAVDDEIYNADVFIAELLAQHGKNTLLFDATSSKIIAASGTVLPNTNSEDYYVVSVTDNVTNRELKKIPFLQYELLSGITTNLTSFFGLYALQNNKLYFLNANPVTVLYYDFSKSATIHCPDGFEPAIAYRAAHILLMKRGDNPEASAFYGSKFQEFMGAYIPVTATNEKS